MKAPFLGGFFHGFTLLYCSLEALRTGKVYLDISEQQATVFICGRAS